MLRNAPQFFREGFEIASFYGAFSPSVWNGGRTVGGGICSERYVRTVLETFNSRGIPLRFTFTNPALKEEHLHDEFCNMVMRLADNGMNEAIVNSPILEQYIRETYPGFKLTSSTCKRITDGERLAQELEMDYSIVVLDYDLNHRFDILEGLPHKEKLEILVNACCDADCKVRREHYRIIGEQQIYYNQHLKEHPGVPFDPYEYDDTRDHPAIKCRCYDRNIFDIKSLPNHISPDEIWGRYISMGFEQFKIEGRTSRPLNLLETYMYYLIKPELRTEARFMFLHNLEANGVVRIDGKV